MGELTKIPQDEAATPASFGAITPMGMISQAVATGASIETVERLIALHERWESGRARKAFDAAISAARAEIKPIVKGSTVDYESKKSGDRTNYSYETLDAIAREVDPILAQHGLSYRFRSRQGDRGGLAVTCIVAHCDGYSEETTLSGPPDQSGNKNAYQAIGSAATYLQRYTLKLALGLSAAKDDDAQGAGRAAEDREPPRFDPRAAAGRIRRSLERAPSLDDLGAVWMHETPVLKDIKAAEPGLYSELERSKDARKLTLTRAASDIGDDEIPY
ncbi:ERF family protein [Rhodovulum sulfidophilum]|uniref:ERF family protein n=1 Tax=Rhodovulum sulfidophilum TaxID=35806 RepID=UPI0019228A25|nr:ERF family protein [Rhodovulum sulfidophilum]MBL3562233.1 ERF family protein [Rhodovulum sulfidophilum]